jgi:hypothetical protein
VSVFLPSGDPRGLRVVGITNRVVKALAFPRTLLAAATERRESQGVGIYFLFGTREDADRESVYIGEAERCCDRLATHDGDPAKEFWNTAVVISSDVSSFTKAHVRALEFESIGQARAADRYAVENGNSGSQPHLTESMAAEVSEVIEDLGVLLGTLGFPVFEPLRTQAKQDKSPTGEVFRYHGKSFDGRLVRTPEGFVILKDSIARLTPVASSADLEVDRQRLVAQGALAKEASGYRFLRDWLFRSPSAAGEMIGGGSVNGWEAWKTDRGRSLDDVYRKAATGEAC